MSGTARKDIINFIGIGTLANTGAIILGGCIGLVCAMSNVSYVANLLPSLLIAAACSLLG